MLYALLDIYFGGSLPLARGAPLFADNLWGIFWQILTRVPIWLWAGAAILFSGTILGVSLYRVWQLRQGGKVVAALLGARALAASGRSPAEQRLQNVVEEMAIAAGIAVPPVYLLKYEKSINALVAGHSPSEAVLIVTQGTVDMLSRDELQGVIGHEFSHILNGDMAFNVHLAALLWGLMCIGELGESMTGSSKGVDEPRGPGFGLPILGAFIAFAGFPGVYAADALRAAYSRRREELADSASVQFTRNPDGIAGALDTVLALKASTHVRTLHVRAFSHLFFCQAVSHWWSFPTHPPIEARLRRVNPYFPRDEYRRARHGLRDEVAVIDGAGNVVKTLRGRAVDTGNALAHETKLDAAAKILAAIPHATPDRLQSPAGAVQVVIGLATWGSKTAREHVRSILEARRGSEYADEALVGAFEIDSLGPGYRFPLAELALPMLKELDSQQRGALLADLRALIEPGREATLCDFVLLTFLRQHLRDDAGRPIRTTYRRVADVSDDARTVLSLVAHVVPAESARAFAAGAPALGIDLDAPLALPELTHARISESVERLRTLAPLQKPRMLKACLDAAASDGVIQARESDLIRMVAAALDCPLPAAVTHLALERQAA